MRAQRLRRFLNVASLFNFQICAVTYDDNSYTNTWIRGNRVFYLSPSAEGIGLTLRVRQVTGPQLRRNVTAGAPQDLNAHSAYSPPTAARTPARIGLGSNPIRDPIGVANHQS